MSGAKKTGLRADPVSRPAAGTNAIDPSDLYGDLSTTLRLLGCLNMAIEHVAGGHCTPDQASFLDESASLIFERLSATTETVRRHAGQPE